MPLPLAVIPAALGAFKAGQGVLQGLKAKKLEKGLIRPDAVSESEKEVLGQMGQMAYGGVPGEAEARADIQKGGANTMAQLSQATTNPNQLLTSAIASQQNTDMANRELNTNIANQKMGLLGKYLDYKAQIGQTEQSDKMQQFEDKAATISALKAAGRENVMAGLQDIGGAAISGLGSGGGATMTTNPMGKGTGLKIGDAVSNVADSSTTVSQSAYQSALKNLAKQKEQELLAKKSKSPIFQ